jgi:hypothetical protein
MVTDRSLESGWASLDPRGSRKEAIQGRPLVQLQDAGMRTVKLDEIVRQRDPELEALVEQLARGQVGEAIGGLERQAASMR